MLLLLLLLLLVSYAHTQQETSPIHHSLHKPTCLQVSQPIVTIWQDK